MEVQETDTGDGTDGTESPEVAEGPTRQVVEFRLGEDYCAIDIDEVDSIVEIKKVTRIPRTPDSIDGVMDLRGETTAIINPRTFLGIDGDQPTSEEQNVLVLDRADDKQKIGIRVDEVLEVTTHPESRIDTDDDLSDLQTRGIEEEISRGIIRKPSGDALDLVVWIDIDVIIEQLK
ncbi:chemotaxis protein CheW [Halorussus limi]|uniref:Chemotaxis protein CheW n=1 Tax=Halorussus limi TaxID=2938695 RepID=A0A8U0HUG8_9EURY|nr:chemotaxis protein CheW [Halorussus limi]UPV74401.1 chemotaxis protein CheW [Halorussus limi]